MSKRILKYFSKRISQELDSYLNDDLEEIRLRANKPMILKYDTYEKLLNYTTTTENILETLQNICEN